MDSAIDFLRNWLPLGRRDDGSEAAQALKGRMAFWKGVKVTE